MPDNKNTTDFWNGAFVKKSSTRRDIHIRSLHMDDTLMEEIRFYNVDDERKNFKAKNILTDSTSHVMPFGNRTLFLILNYWIRLIIYFSSTTI